MEAAGIAPASQTPRGVWPHTTCLEHGCQLLHYVCTEEALHELVANWHHLAPNVRAAITKLVRSSGEPSVSDRSPAAACSAKPIVAGYDNYVWCPLNPGHQVWVYCQMTGKRNVMPRLKEILEREGLKVGIMRADDVEPKEREEWIAEARSRVRRDDLLPEARQHWARPVLEGAGRSQLQLHRLLRDGVQAERDASGRSAGVAYRPTA